MSVIEFQPECFDIFCDNPKCGVLLNTDRFLRNGEPAPRFFGEYIIITTVNTGEVNHYCDNVCRSIHNETKKEEENQRRE